MGFYRLQRPLINLIVKAGGNNRSENGPAVGSPYWRYNSSGTMADAGTRPDGISSNDGYDILSLNSTAKNILVVGAVNPISNGYTKPSDVVMSSFSSWGPTDDGRIKPDVVADGVGLLSSIATSDNAYASYSGTSMASPTAAGSLLLLQEYYSQLNSGTFMRSATLKGLVIHTADEAGSAPGPDYQNGWGLINMTKAAAVITANNTTHIIEERQLDNSDNFSYSLPVIASGNGKISATISWTDPKAETIASFETALNNTAKKLVNDLDIVIKRGAATYQPWVLIPSVPSAAATTGNNVLDNVEKVELPDVIPGQTYTIEVTHKGTLARGLQAYSLIVSGVGGQAYCNSSATSTSGARIDSVSFSNIRNKNAAGCTSYSNFTNLTGDLQPGQTLPLFIRLNSCDATAVDKIVKVYIDANNDGDFTDANENIATSAVINGNGDYTTNITVPAGLTPGKYSIIRIVMQETSVAANITPCGTYAKGETQDYRVLISMPATDMGISGLVSPQTGDCGLSSQYVTVRIRNFGSTNQGNIPVTATIKQGAATIATLNAVYTDIIEAQSEEAYTFQTPFNALPATTYSITSATAFTGDQDASNDQNITSYTSNANSSNPAGTAVICGSSNVLLNATPVTNDLFNWYNSPTATNPIATGADATTSTIAATYYVSKNDVSTKLGPANKLVFADGGYNAFVNNMVRVSTSVPVSIQTARLYIGNSGKITFLLREIVSYNETTGAYNYFPVSSRTIDVTATAPTPPVLGGANNNPNDLGAIYYLGIDIPTPGNYGIVIQCQNGASIFRNNEIPVNPYPFTVPGIISITGNSAILAADPVYYQKFYYFFYDAAVKLAACPSGRVAITPTTVTAPTITITGNVLTSSSATGNQWYLNGSPVSGANSQTYTAVASGLYSAAVTNTNGCTLSSNEINFTLTPVINVDPDLIGLIVSPNPTTTGQFNVQLETNTRANLYITLANTAGQKVYQYTTQNFIGRLSKMIEPGKLSAGIYYLQVQHDKKMYVKKIVVTQ
ncbi:MAG: S8 family serine peptidase [Bacteroidota bacterium]